MLVTVLHTSIADEISVKIIDAFVYMRKYISNDTINSKMLVNHENRLLKLE